AARGRLGGAAPAGQPLDQGQRPHAAHPSRGARARTRGRGAAGAPAASPRARARRPRPLRLRVPGHPGDDPRAGKGAARRGRVPRRSLGRHGPAGVPARLAGDARGAARLGPRPRARGAAHGSAREGRLLGPRGRGGSAGGLARARLRAQGRLRPQLRGAHAQAARRAPARAPGDRLAQPPLDRARDRVRPGARRRRPRPRAPGPPRTRRRARRGAGRAGAPRARLLPGRRPRGRDGLPGAAPAREHLERVLPRRAAAGRAARGAARGAVTPPAGFTNEPTLELRRAAAREALREALAELDRRLPLSVPVIVGGDRGADSGIESTDPGRPDRLAASAGRAGEPEAAAAVEAATRGARDWGARAASERAAILERAAAILRERRHALAALEVRECAKPWAEADADVCEAIDYLRYYGRRAIELERGAPVEQVPGERNAMRYVPRGVCAVIAPWNFPLAIPAGMASGALAAGNAVVVKPAEQSPACALALAEALHEAGVPPDALALLPGYGDAGAALVRDPRVHVIAFTG